MPLREFQCKCGVRFEEILPASFKDTTYKCPDCGKKAKLLISAASFTFAHIPNGPGPQNTGTSLDWNYDKIIGRDAESKWGAIKERQSEKLRILKDNPG